MRQYFTPQELTDHCTMLPQEHVLLANKSGVNRLGFVVLFKYCQWEGRFPEHWQEVPRSLVQHLAAPSIFRQTRSTRTTWQGAPRAITKSRFEST